MGTYDGHPVTDAYKDLLPSIFKIVLEKRVARVGICSFGEELTPCMIGPNPHIKQRLCLCHSLETANSVMTENLYLNEQNREL